MYEDFFRKRLIQLRMEKGVSARDMSLSIGQSASYMNKIENGKAMPSMEVFFYICDYFGLQPRDFFSENRGGMIELDMLLSQLAQLDDESICLVRRLIQKLGTCANK